MTLNFLLPIALLRALVVGERLSSLMGAVPLPVDEGAAAHLSLEATALVLCARCEVKSKSTELNP